MLITNNGAQSITMNLRDGSSYVLTPGVPVRVPDAATTMIDDSAYLIGLFNAGTLTVTTDAGGAFAGFPTTVNAADSAAGKALHTRARVGGDGTRTLIDETGQAIPTGGSGAVTVTALNSDRALSAADHRVNLAMTANRSVTVGEGGIEPVFINSSDAPRTLTIQGTNGIVINGIANGSVTRTIPARGTLRPVVDAANSYDVPEPASSAAVALGGPYVMTSVAPKVDQLNTPATNKTTTTLAVDGRYLRIDYRRTAATSNGTVLYVALNAATGTEADTILGSTSLGRYAIPIGSFLELEFPANAPLRRIDISSDAASETANSTVATIVYGVAA